MTDPVATPPQGYVIMDMAADALEEIAAKYAGGEAKETLLVTASILRSQHDENFRKPTPAPQSDESRNNLARSGDDVARLDDVIERAERLLTEGAPSWETHNAMIAELAAFLRRMRRDSRHMEGVLKSTAVRLGETEQERSLARQWLWNALNRGEKLEAQLQAQAEEIERLTELRATENVLAEGHIERLATEAKRYRAALEQAPILSKYHGEHGFERERFIADYDAWRAGIARVIMGNL